MLLLMIVVLPFLGLVLPLLAGHGRRALCTLLAALAPLVALALLLTLADATLSGLVLQAGFEWLPGLGLNPGLRLDGLGLLFSLLILGIGLLVILYAHYYLGEDEPVGRFYAFLLLFMGAMLGLVLSANLLQMLVFWELTSLSSFLLIGFWGHRSDARRGARMALAVTAGGGLAFLPGFRLIGRWAAVLIWLRCWRPVT